MVETDVVRFVGKTIICFGKPFTVDETPGLGYALDRLARRPPFVPSAIVGQQKRLAHLHICRQLRRKRHRRQTVGVANQPRERPQIRLHRVAHCSPVNVLRFLRAEYSLAQKCVAAWSNFARNGDPNCDTLPDWPSYSFSSINSRLPLSTFNLWSKSHVRC